MCYKGMGNDISYKDLKKYYDENKYDIYTNQDFEESGKSDVKSIFVENESNIFERMENSKVLLRLLQLIMDDKENISQVIQFLEEYPMINYYRDFIELLNGRIDSGFINKNELIKLGRELAFEGTYKNEIKLGLSLLYFDNIKEIEEKLCLLGLYNEYSFYVAQLIRKLKNSDEILFNLAKLTRGAGRAIYTNYLDMLNAESEEWLVCEGWKDSNYQTLLWNTTVIKVGYEAFMSNSFINKNTFKAFSEILNNIFLYFNYKNIECFNKMITKYIDLFSDCHRDVQSYIAFGNVYRYVVEEWKSEDEYYKKAQKIYLEIDWMKVLSEAIKDENINSALLFQLAVEMEEDLSVDELRGLLKRDPRDETWYRYIEMLDETPYSNLLIDVVRDTFNLNEIFTEDKSLLIIAIEALTRESAIYNKEFLIECLSSDVVEIRLVVISKLESIKDELTEEGKEGILVAIKNEVVECIKNKLIFLLYENSNNFIVTDISYPTEKVEDVDIFLNKIMISSITANKLLCHEVLINEGDILDLSNTLDGYKDDRIFIITNFGVVLGELSNRDSDIIKNLILAGEKVIARIDRYDDKMDFMYISLYKKSNYLMNELRGIINEKFKFLVE